MLPLVIAAMIMRSQFVWYNIVHFCVYPICNCLLFHTQDIMNGDTGLLMFISKHKQLS